MLSRRSVLAIGGTPLLGMRFGDALAQVAQPKFYYGFSAGSSGDIVTRAVADRVGGSAYATRSAVVENRTGAGGQLALAALKSSAKDGSILALTPASCTAIYPHTYRTLSYNPTVDFAPVSFAAMMYLAFAVGPMVPSNVRNVSDFVVWAKANPNQASFASPGAGTSAHFVGALLGINSGVDMKHVPYRGSIPGIADVIGGQIPGMVTASGDFISHMKAGKLRVLATSGTNRSPYLPDVPTFAEQGFGSLTNEEWLGFFAPAGTPSNVIDDANAAIKRALTDPKLIETLGAVGLVARGSTPGQMAESQNADLKRWERVVKQIGFTADS